MSVVRVPDTTHPATRHRSARPSPRQNRSRSRKHREHRNQRQYLTAHPLQNNTASAAQPLPRRASLDFGFASRFRAIWVPHASPVLGRVGVLVCFRFCFDFCFCFKLPCSLGAPLFPGSGKGGCFDCAFDFDFALRFHAI
jgi:hypothetical protein